MGEALPNEELTKPLRVRSLGTKVSESEYAACEKVAAGCGLTVSEWCRQVVLAATGLGVPGQEAEVILSEVLALRMIVMNLIYRQATGAPLNEEQMRQLVEQADADKLRKAGERLQALGRRPG